MHHSFPMSDLMLLTELQLHVYVEEANALFSLLFIFGLCAGGANPGPLVLPQRRVLLQPGACFLLLCSGVRPVCWWELALLR